MSGLSGKQTFFISTMASAYNHKQTVVTWASHQKADIERLLCAFNVLIFK